MASTRPNTNISNCSFSQLMKGMCSGNYSRIIYISQRYHQIFTAVSQSLAELLWLCSVFLDVLWVTHIVAEYVSHCFLPLHITESSYIQAHRNSRHLVHTTCNRCLTMRSCSTVIPQYRKVVLYRWHRNNHRRWFSLVITKPRALLPPTPLPLTWRQY